MSYVIRHRLGDEDVDPDSSALERLFDELALTDEEHVDVAVTHESGSTLAAYRSGGVTWENVGAAEPRPRHMEEVSRERMLELARAVAAGNLERVDREHWLPGYY